MDIVERLRLFGSVSMDEEGRLGPFETNPLTAAAADEIERLRAAGDALGAFVMQRLPHDGWTTADRDFAAVVLDAWEEARRG